MKTPVKGLLRLDGDGSFASVMVFTMERSGQIGGWSQENLPMGWIWKLRGREGSRGIPRSLA